MPRKRVLILLLSLITSLFVPLTSNTGFAQENAYPTGVNAQDISGEEMVYMKYDGDWDIYYYNVSTGENKKITGAIGSQGYPAISGNYIVWQDNRNYLNETSPYFDIYLYDLTTGQEQKISQHKGYNNNPEIYGNIVVWLDNAHLNSSVYVYDINTKTEKRITDNYAKAFGIQVYQDQIVWMDARNDSFDIYSYNLSTNTEKQITYSDAKQADPKIIEGNIVWHDYREGNRQVYSYNNNTGKEEKLSSGSSEATIVAADNGKLVYRQDDTEYVMHDYANGNDYRVTGVGLYDTIFLSENEIYWSDGKNLTKNNLNDVLILIERNNQNANKNINNIDKPSPNNYVNSETGWISFNANGGAITSPDNNFKINIPNGFVTDNLKIKITELNNYETQPTSRLISKFYKIETDGILTGKVEIDFTNLLEQTSSLDLRKVLAYGLDLNDNSWILLNKKPKELNSKLEIDSKRLTTIVLGYYQDSAFVDLNNHWSKENIEVLNAHQIINGYQDNSFKPDKSITRAEFVKILISALDLKPLNDNNSSFTDIKDHWAQDYINIAYQNEIVKGNNGNFNPDSEITREELITIMVRALENQEQIALAGSLSDFEDQDLISDWSRPYIEYAVDNGLIEGKSGKIAPLDLATRAEAATVILRLFNKID